MMATMDLSQTCPKCSEVLVDRTTTIVRFECAGCGTRFVSWLRGDVDGHVTEELVEDRPMSPAEFVRARV